MFVHKDPDKRTSKIYLKIEKKYFEFYILKLTVLVMSLVGPNFEGIFQGLSRILEVFEILLLTCALLGFILMILKKNVGVKLGFISSLLHLVLKIIKAYFESEPTSRAYLLEAWPLALNSLGLVIFHLRKRGNYLMGELIMENCPVQRKTSSRVRNRRILFIFLPSCVIIGALVTPPINLFTTLKTSVIITLVFFLISKIANFLIYKSRRFHSDDSAILWEHFLLFWKGTMVCEIRELASDTSGRKENSITEVDWGGLFRNLPNKLSIEYYASKGETILRLFLHSRVLVSQKKIKSELDYFKNFIESCFSIRESIVVEWISWEKFAEIFHFHPFSRKSGKLTRKNTQKTPKINEKPIQTFQDKYTREIFVASELYGIIGRGERLFKKIGDFELNFIDQFSRVCGRFMFNASVYFNLKPSKAEQVKGQVPTIGLSQAHSGRLVGDRLKKEIDNNRARRRKGMPRKKDVDVISNVEEYGYFWGPPFIFQVSILIHGYPEQIEKMYSLLLAIDGLLKAQYGIVCRPIRSKRNLKMAFVRNFYRRKVWEVPEMILNSLLSLPITDGAQDPKIALPKLNSPPLDVCQYGTIHIGKLFSPSGFEPREFNISLNDFKRHVFICGSTGTGKTFLLFNILLEIERQFKKIKYLLFDFKGEYKYIKERGSELTVLVPGKNFGVNFFVPIVDDPQLHAERIFSSLRDCQFLNDFGDYSPQMERSLIDILVIVASNPRLQSYEGFVEACTHYLTYNENRIPYLAQTLVGIQNRLRRFFVGPLRAIYDFQNAGAIEQAFKKNCVIDLRNIFTLGGGKEDISFFVNMVFNYLWAENLRRGPSQDIKHITIIDDAQFLAPIQDPRARTNVLEDSALLLRGTGEILFILATRPAISENILANTGTVFSFQVAYDQPVMGRVIGLNEENIEILGKLPPKNCVVKLTRYPFPFLLTVKDIHGQG